MHLEWFMSASIMGRISKRLGEQCLNMLFKKQRTHGTI